METQADRRLRKLRWLCATFKDKGGLQFVADEAQLNVNTLDQVLKGVLLPPKADGSRSPRKLGDLAVERMEAAPALGLGRGWFDTDDGYDDFEVIPPAPALATALPVVLDAIARAPARAELRNLLQMLVDADSPHYRQRLAELLAAPPIEDVTATGRPGLGAARMLAAEPPKVDIGAKHRVKILKTYTSKAGVPTQTPADADPHES